MKDGAVRFPPLFEGCSFLLLAAIIEIVASPRISSHWVEGLLYLAACLFTLGDSYVILIKNSNLIFVSLGPLNSNLEIPMNKILNIKSAESYQSETVFSYENEYPVFRRKYIVSYLNNQEKTKLFQFKIFGKSNQKRFAEIMRDKFI
jgi:hypothetical protein